MKVVLWFILANGWVGYWLLAVIWPRRFAAEWMAGNGSPTNG